MIQMTELMARLIAAAPDDGVPCLVGTSSKDGYPQISPKGSVAVLDPETLCFWERSFRSSYDAIEANPHIVVYYRNQKSSIEMPYRGSALRFHGDARVVTEGPERDRAWELCNKDEQARDPEKKGAAILIRVDKIEEISGNVVMQRD
jgi:predicted pyridoxine 5'-phosphate oxidase superfamily flavin-nucleotide-binding protein